MSNRGVRQLRKLSVFFCDWGASSNGVRELLGSTQLKEFHQNNPHVDLEFIIKRNHHPFVSSTFINGYIKDIPLRSLDTGNIMEHFQSCNTSFGRSAVEASGKRVVGVKQSIQGKWYPNMWGNYPRAQMEVLHIVQEPKPTVVYKPIRPKKMKPTFDKHHDIITRMRNRRSQEDIM